MAGNFGVVSKEDLKLLGRLTRFFPLTSVESVVKLFRHQLDEEIQPNLAFISIVLGLIENSVINVYSKTASEDAGETGITTSYLSSTEFPIVQLNDVLTVYEEFTKLVRSKVDLADMRENGSGKAKCCNADLIKRVSDVIWSCLSRSYHEEKGHIQSLFSLMTDKKLDCFGVALCTIAACRLLGLDNIHLALSEDHAWAAIGQDGSELFEITWHGKGAENRRGCPVTKSMMENSWLYLNGNAITCTYAMEVAAAVCSINTRITSNIESRELNTLQQQLLWLLYDRKHLERYPMAIAIIAELEKISPTVGRPSPLTLFNRSIVSAKTHYNDMHVYPYTHLASYYCSNGQFKAAMKVWSDAARVIGKYNYDKCDEEIYKEFIDIANETIPRILKLAVEDSMSTDKFFVMKNGSIELPLIKDPEFCMFFFKFYDGLCEWEEGSSTPVLHITWARHMLSSLYKFDSTVRANVELDNDNSRISVDEKAVSKSEKCLTESKSNIAKEKKSGILHTSESSVVNSGGSKTIKVDDDCVLSKENEFSKSKKERKPGTVRTSSNQNRKFCESAKEGNQVDDKETGNMFLSIDACRSNDGKAENRENILSYPNSDKQQYSNARKCRLELRSSKMQNMKHLLVATKLNSNSIQLQLTAQSQIHSKQSWTGFDYGYGKPTKRSRRESLDK